MDIIKIIGEKLQQNSYLIVNGSDAVLIDAGAKVSKIEEALKMYSKKPKLKAVFLTHEHSDHIYEINSITEKYNCDVFIHVCGIPAIFKPEENLSIMDDSPLKISSRKSIKSFDDGDIMSIGDISIKCLHTPGHSKGSSCFIVEDNMFTGDTVFKVGVGRTDLVGGNANTLLISIRKIVSEMNNVKHFYAGHGANALMEEMKYNIENIVGEKI